MAEETIDRMSNLRRCGFTLDRHYGAFIENAQEERFAHFQPITTLVSNGVSHPGSDDCRF
jgi:hypothetical protein